MPCYSQQTSVVQFGVQTDPALLQKALERLGYRVQKTSEGLVFNKADQDGSFVRGKMTLTSNTQADMNVFKRAYSAEVVRASAARFGWQLKQSAPNAFQVTRRF